MAIDPEKIADIWVSHSEKLWRAVFATPLSVIAILGAWYSLLIDGQIILARLVLLLGILIMLFLFLVIGRMAQYDGALFDAIKDDLPDIPAPLFSLRGRSLAQAVPLFLGVMLILLLAIGRPPEL